MLTRTLGPGDGCTILSPLTQPCCPITGYVVGLRGVPLDFKVIEDTMLWDASIIKLLKMYRRCGCESAPNFGIGTWLCSAGADRHVHFDIVFHTLCKHTALLTAFMYNQVAIYDVEKGEAFYVVRPDDEEDSQETYV